MSNNQVSNLSAAQLREAADLHDQIDALESQLKASRSRLQALLSGGAASDPTAPAASVPSRKRGRKPKGTATVPEPERKKRGRKPKASSGTVVKKSPKRKMSAEGRARIQEAVKARWERVRAAKVGT